MRRSVQLVALLLLAAASPLLGGCETWFGETETPLAGQRVSVMTHQQTLQPDKAANLDDIVLPEAVLNPEWPQAGGSAERVMGNLEFSPAPATRWQADIGTAARPDRPALPAPVVAAGRVFTLDGWHTVRAFDVNDGTRLWEADLADDAEDDDALPGGLAFDRGRVFVTTGFGTVFALNGTDGRQIWKRRIDYPIHAPAAVSGGKLYFVSVENTLHALDQANGNDAWPPFRAIAEPARILGGGTPAVAGDALVVPFSSGELVALRTDSGRVAWSDTLATARRSGELTSLGQIRGLPVIDRNRVYAISQGGLLACIDLPTGRRLWERDIGGINTPWVAGQFIYLISNDGELVALSADSGRIYWVTELPRYEDEKEREGAILWSGPVLAGDRLIVVGSAREALVISSYNGGECGEPELSAGTLTPPVVAGGKVIIVTDDGRITAYQ
jgi:outer membrane protein assembly factor BamB